jgi:hypothetical protein
MGVIEQARERWLQSVIDFVNMDLDQLRPGDWLNLQEDLVRLAGFRRRTPKPLAPRHGLCPGAGQRRHHAT